MCNNYLFIIILSHTGGLVCMLISTIPLFLMEKGKYNLGNGGHRHSFYSTFGLFSGIHCSCLVHVFVITTMTNCKIYFSIELLKSSMEIKRIICGHC